MSDQFVVTKRTGCLSNIMNSFVGVFIGVILFVAAFPVLWFNEGRTNMAKVAQSSVLVDAAQVNPQTEGKQVAVSGTLTANEALGDAPYLAPGSYIQLQRKVEMFAWVEHESSRTKDNVGGGSTTTTTYSYTQEWTDHPESSRSFKRPAGHTNPALPIEGYSFLVASARVGAYSFDPADITLPSAQALPLDGNTISPDADARVSGNYFLLGTGSLDAPRLGDVRISYLAVAANAPAIAFGRQQGTQLVPYRTPQGDELYRLFVHTDRDGAIQQMDTEYRVMGWILRLAGFLMMWFGLMFSLGPISAFLNILPFLGGISRTAISWLSFPIALVLSVITIVISIILHSWVALLIILVLIIGGVTLQSKLRAQRG